MLHNLRNSIDYKEKGKIHKLRKRVIQNTELSYIDSSIPDNEFEEIKRKKLEAVRTLEIKRAKQLIDQIEEWDDSDFDDATLLLDEEREDEVLLDALQKRKQLAEVTIEINNSFDDITEETAEEVKKIKNDLAAAKEKVNAKAQREKMAAEKEEKRKKEAEILAKKKQDEAEHKKIEDDKRKQIAGEKRKQWEVKIAEQKKKKRRKG